MKYFVFIFFLISGFVKGIQFPSHEPGKFSEDDMLVLIKPFAEKEWQYGDQKHPYSSEYTQAQKTLENTLVDLVDMYHSTFPNQRSIKNANNSALYQTFSKAVSDYSSIMLLLLDHVGNVYVKSMAGHAPVPGFLQRVYEQNYAESFVQFQRMALTIFSNIAFKNKAKISHPYGSMHLIKEYLPIQYFWDENGPVPFTVAYQKKGECALAKLSYGQMKMAIPRLFVVSPETDIISAPGFYMMQTKRGIEVSFSRGLVEEEGILRVLDSSKKSDISMISPDHDSFTGLYNKAGSFSMVVKKEHKFFEELQKSFGKKTTNFIPMPT